MTILWTGSAKRVSPIKSSAPFLAARLFEAEILYACCSSRDVLGSQVCSKMALIAGASSPSMPLCQMIDYTCLTMSYKHRKNIQTSSATSPTMMSTPSNEQFIQWSSAVSCCSHKVLIPHCSKSISSSAMGQSARVKRVCSLSRS